MSNTPKEKIYTHIWIHKYKFFENEVFYYTPDIQPTPAGWSHESNIYELPDNYNVREKSNGTVEFYNLKNNVIGNLHYGEIDDNKLSICEDGTRKLYPMNFCSSYDVYMYTKQINDMWEKHESDIKYQRELIEETMETEDDFGIYEDCAWAKFHDSDDVHFTGEIYPITTTPEFSDY